MKIRHSVVAAAFMAFLLMGIHTEEWVSIDGQDARVLRRPDDGLEGVVGTRLHLREDLALASCASWDIKENCCPAGCAAKKGSNWPKADEILRGCMRGLGCSETEAKSATVFMKCDCPK